jgi:hypothetical protein
MAGLTSAPPHLLSHRLPGAPQARASHSGGANAPERSPSSPRPRPPSAWKAAPSRKLTGWTWRLRLVAAGPLRSFARPSFAALQHPRCGHPAGCAISALTAPVSPWLCRVRGRNRPSRMKEGPVRMRPRRRGSRTIHGRGADIADVITSGTRRQDRKDDLPPRGGHRRF